MLNSPFLTELDSRAAVKGSRDPLGAQQVWTRLGRHIIGNLTTVTDSVRDFTTLLVGYYFVESLAEEYGPEDELKTFLKWEQLAAYARAAINGDTRFRGTERVRKNLSENRRITISADQAHQILGNQKIYGLWGLYTMPARASGLVEIDPPRLTPPAREFVETRYLPTLNAGKGKGTRWIAEALRSEKTRLDVEGAGAPMLEVIARILKRRIMADEREFYRDYLLHGGPADPTGGRQKQLAQLLGGTLNQDDFTWSTTSVGSLAKEARNRGEGWHGLAHHLERIRTSETVLGPSSALFAHLLGLDGQSVDVLAKRLQEGWGARLRTVDPIAFRELKGDIGGVADAEDRWIAIADSMAAGRYGSLVELLVEQNKAVMASRGGAPWLEFNQKKLRVRFREERGYLPTSDDIPWIWRFPYFLDSLRSIASALGED